MYNLNYTPTTLGVQSWREIISGGTRTKKVEYRCYIVLASDNVVKYTMNMPQIGYDRFLLMAFSIHNSLSSYQEGVMSEKTELF
jgi:hypothetical protein